MSPYLARLSVNQITVRSWSAPQLIDGCLRAGVPAIGLLHHAVANTGLAETAARVADAGLRVSSLCRGGFVTAADPAGYRAALDDNRQAIDEAAQLRAACLVLVVGGLAPGSRDLAGARARVAEALAALVPFARQRAVSLALEPCILCFAPNDLCFPRSPKR
jgi:sugar phosphate isomerase/epimerase